MKRKHLFTAFRILISVGLIAFVCSRISINDTLEKKNGDEVVGRLQKDGAGPEVFVIKTADGQIVTLPRKTILAEDGHLVGVKRGIVTVFRDLDLSWYIPVFLLAGIIPVIGALRLHMLLAVQGVKLSRLRVLGLTFIGFFFSNFMLGLTGGDVVKAYYVMRETKKRGEALVTVFLDRLVGLISMAMLAGAMVVLNLNDPKFASAALYVWIFLIAALFAGLMLYSRRLRRKGHLAFVVVAAVGGGALMISRLCTYGWSAIRTELLIFAGVLAVLAVVSLVPALKRAIGLHMLRDKLAASKMVRDMDQALHVFSKHTLAGVAAVVMSLVCHMITICLVFGFARSLGMAHVAFRYFLVFVPVIIIISAMPISLAGWGVQEAVFQVFFGSVGVGPTEAVTLSFIYRLSYAVLWSLPGGAVLMLKKDRASVDEVERGVSREETAS